MIRNGGLRILLALLLTANGAAWAAPPPSSLPVPFIQSVTHDARAPLTAGRRLTVRLRGTPGGVAQFHIAGVAMGLGMHETPSADGQTSTYVGTYLIRPRDAAPLAAITATLKVGTREIIAAGDRPVAIDARPPEVATPLPAPGAHLANLRPNILLRFFDGESSVDPGTVKLVINGRDVSRRTAITPAFAAYTPESAFTPGVVRVQAVVRDVAGNVSRVNWDFTVGQPGGLIDSVTVSSVTGLKPGDYLTVVMAGAPKGRASLAVAGSSQSIPMRESSRTPGTYVGLYPIGFKHQGSLIQVTARLSTDGRSSTATAIAAVPVMGRTPRPTIAGPDMRTAADEHTLQRIMLTGRARPGYRVVVLLSARTESANGGAWSPLVSAYAAARQDGAWSLSLGPVVPWFRASLFLTAVAVDLLGQRSPPVTLALGAAPTPREAVAPAPEEPKTASQESPSGKPSTPAPQPSSSPVPGSPQPASPPPQPTAPQPASPQPAPPPPSPPQPASSPQPAPSLQQPAAPAPAAPRQPQCPQGQVLDPKTDQCVPAEPDSAGGRERSGASSPPPSGPSEQPADPKDPPAKGPKK